VAHGIEKHLGRATESGELAEVLARCDRDYRRENPAAAWPEDYARRLLAPVE
jgi:hypothetical protein